MYFNPIKSAASMLMTTITLLLLSYTHAQAFRAGVGVNQNPFLLGAAHMLGMAPPQAPCASPDSQEQKPWWKSIPGVSHSQTGHDIP